VGLHASVVVECVTTEGKHIAGEGEERGILQGWSWSVNVDLSPGLKDCVEDPGIIGWRLWEDGSSTGSALSNLVTGRQENSAQVLASHTVGSVGWSWSDWGDLGPCVGSCIVLPHVVDVISSAVDSSEDGESFDSWERISVISISGNCSSWVKLSDCVEEDVVDVESSSGSKASINSSEQVDVDKICLLDYEGEELWESVSGGKNLSPLVGDSVVLPEVIEGGQRREEEWIISSPSNHEGVIGDFPGSVENSCCRSSSSWIQMSHVV